MHLWVCVCLLVSGDCWNLLVKFDTIELYMPFECFQLLATPREVLLNKVPFPLPTPNIFNLDEINALTVDTLVSETGRYNTL